MKTLPMKKDPPPPHSEYTDIYLVLDEEMEDFSGYYWVVATSQEKPQSDAIVRFWDKNEELGEPTCIAGQCIESQTVFKQNQLFGEQYKMVTDAFPFKPFNTKVSGEDLIDPNVYGFLNWYRHGPGSIDEPPKDYDGLLEYWNRQFPTLEDSPRDRQPPTLDVRNPEIEITIKSPKHGKTYYIKDGLLTLKLAGVIKVKGKKEPDDHHHWDVNGERHIGRKHEIKLKVGTYDVTLEHEPTGHKQTIKIEVEKHKKR